MNKQKPIIKMLTLSVLVLFIVITSACEKIAPEPQLTSSETELVPSETELTPPEIPKRILFIGNSLTFWNNGLDYHITQLAGSDDPPMDIRADSVVKGGATLKVMWENTEARNVISEGNYDVVVLQEALSHGFALRVVARRRKCREEELSGG